MAALHIEDFYKDCARILLQLFASFPRKSTVFVEDISGADLPDEFGVHSKRFLGCFGTMIWLAEEGYLRFETTIRQEAIDQAILSSKGFLLLSRQTLQKAALSDSGTALPETNADRIQRLLKSESSSRLAAELQQMLLGT
jgi:hypothetical protein